MNFGIFINFTPEFSIWPIFESAFFDIFSAQISAKIDFLLQKIAFSHYRIESVTFQMNQNNKKFPISKAKCFKWRKFCPFYELKCEKKACFNVLKLNKNTIFKNSQKLHFLPFSEKKFVQIDFLDLLSNSNKTLRFACFQYSMFEFWQIFEKSLLQITFSEDFWPFTQT